MKLNEFQKACSVVTDKNNSFAELSKWSGMSIPRLKQLRAEPQKLETAKWIAVHKLAEMYDEKEHIGMNTTIKNLVRSKIVNFITIDYGDHVEVKRNRVDVKKGQIRLWDTPRTLHTSLSLADLNCTEDEAKQLVKDCVMEALFALSDKPVTTNFDVKKGGF